MSTKSDGPAYDRQLLLAGAKRNAVLALTKVQRYGIEGWGDPDYVCQWAGAEIGSSSTTSVGPTTA